MCNPLLMSTAMGGGSFIQGMGQRSAARKMNDIQRDISAQNEANAIEAAVRGMESMAVKAKQQDFAAGQQAKKVRLQSALAMGRFVAGAAQAGIEGTTQETLQSDFDLQEALAMYQVDKQQQFTQQANQQQLEQLQVQTQGRINAAAPNLQPVPSIASVAFNAVSSGISGAMMGHQMTNGGTTGFFSSEPLPSNATWWDKLTLL